MYAWRALARVRRMLMLQTLRCQRGVSLLEVMVGLSLGLVVVGSAMLWLADQTRYARQLSAKARVQQELVTLSRFVTMQVRNAGHSATWARAALGHDVNPFATVEAGPQALRFHIDRDKNGKMDTTDSLAFALNQGRLTLRVGTSGAQELNDPGTVYVTGFVSSLHFSPGASGGCFAQLVWRIEGRAPGDNTPSARMDGVAALPNLTRWACAS